MYLKTDSRFLPLASSTPMQVKSCGQSVRIDCDSESEDTHTASEDEDEREFAVSFRTLGNDKNISLEEVVFDTEQYGTDDNGAAEAGDDVTNAMDVIIAKKCLAFVPSILNLLKRAYGDMCARQGCQRRLLYSTTTVGTALTVVWSCSAGHLGGRWQSQPRFDGIFAGNLQTAACILLSGNSFRKIELLFRFANIACISASTFVRVQKLYAAPAIQKYWEAMQLELTGSFHGQKVVLCGDGRNDSPGHSAQYLSYNVGDTSKQVILHTETVDVREVNGKSPNMERLGFDRSMDKLTGMLDIGEMITDAHTQIAAAMRHCEKYSEIKHSWDIWHGGKNIHKKILEASKQRACKDLLPWANALRNHFWYAAKECNGSERKMKAIWFGILHHVVDEHEWILNHDGTYGKCGHGPLSDGERIPWLIKGSPSHVALRKIVEDKRLMKNIPYYVNFRHTGFLESFHSHLLMYAPKRLSYSFVGYKARTVLAAIDFNKHANRQKEVAVDGQPSRYYCKYSKMSKRFYPVPVVAKKKYDYTNDIQQQIFEMRLGVEGHLSQYVPPAENDPCHLHTRLSMMNPPNIADLVEAHKSRFAKSTTSEESI
ncbi:uncharacterized protein [Ptychodera flava]|uniref:uncharacterized protein isoform X3 n=1 Tax=Ptychodera flava TaxID=63121 RepID=UPI00396A67C8